MRRSCCRSRRRKTGGWGLGTGKESIVQRVAMVLTLVALVGVQAIGQRGATTTQRIPQFENDSVKVWKSVIVPNAPLTLHRHEHGRTIVALVGGDLKVVKDSGKTEVMHWETGKAYWLGPDPPG